MLLDQKKFYEKLKNIYEGEDLNGAETYLNEKESDLKLAVMPDPGCVMCGNVDVDENGLAAVTKDWIRERNEAISIINYEQGNLYQKMGKGTEALHKYEEAKKLMERTDLTAHENYTKILSKIHEIETV